MSVSQHPIAVRLEEYVSGPAWLLATVMGLPLVDGIFPALIVAGALTGPIAVVETGLLIFGGSATVAVVLAEMDGTRREQLIAIGLLGAILIPLAVVEAALAQTLDTVLTFETFRRFAGLVIFAVAAKTASAEVGRYLPSPGVIVGLGLLASVQPAGFELVVSPDPALLVKAGAAAGVGVAFAAGVALLGPHLRGRVDLDRFRFGSAVALGMLGLRVLGVLPTGDAPVALGVLVVTALFSYDAGGDEASGADPAVPDGGEGGPAAPADDDVTADVDPAPDDIAEAADDRPAAESDPEPGLGEDEDDRAPWL